MLLKKDWARAAMEVAYQRTADGLSFRPLRTPHAVTVMVMALAFHTKDPYGVGTAFNIFLFPDLSPLAGSEAPLLTRKWGAISGGGTLTSFADTSLMMGKQKVAPIAGWDKASSQLEAWAVFCKVFLGDYGAPPPATNKMFLLLEETSGVSLRLRLQACHQLNFPAALLLLIQQEFNESFRKALERRQRVRCPNFESLRRDLVTGNFRPELFTLPSGMAPPERRLPPPSATRRLAATPQVEGNTPSPQAQVRRGNQVQENNPHPAP